MLNVGILGASGYTGAELLRLLAGHSNFEVGVVTGRAAEPSAVGERLRGLASVYPDLEIAPYAPGVFDRCDLVFSGLPHGASQTMATDLLDGGFFFVDLAADFRLKDPGEYEYWYGQPHAAPEAIHKFVYGLPELERDDLASTQAAAVPGCYPTAALLALAPLVRADAIQTDGIVIDAVSGVTGAGRAPKSNTTFGAVNEDFCAYGLLNHRHTPEIQQALGASVLFTPHLAPMSRGILATCYARPLEGVSQEDLQDVYADAYADEPFVSVFPEPPSTKDTLGSNSAHLSVHLDPRTGWVLALCALDNLGKGAAGQAIQCANVICGLPETTGLPLAAVSS